MKKSAKTKELRLEDILFNCRDLLRGKASVAAAADLLKRQSENSKCLAAAFKTLGVKL